MKTIIPTGWTLTSTDTVQVQNVTAGVSPREGCVVLSMKPGAFIPWDNPDNLISRQVEVAMDMVVAVIFLPILFSISLPCNILNMIVFCKQGIQERINLCLFCLAMADSTYMIHSISYNFDKISSQFTNESGVGVVFEFVANHYLMFFRGMNWVSGFLSTMIACERCFCVFSPLRSQQILKTRTTGIIIITGALVILGLNFLSTTRWSVGCVYDARTHSVSKSILPSKFYLQNQKLIDTVTGLVTSFLIPLVYILVVTTTTILTFIKLRKIVQWREQTSSATLSSREIALTRMLIGISVLFVFCSVPVLVLGVCLMFIPDMSLQGRYFNAFNFILSFFELFSYINASVNFFVYFFLGSRFKETLKELCLQCCRSVKHPRNLRKE